MQPCGMLPQDAWPQRPRQSQEALNSCAHALLHLIAVIAFPISKACLRCLDLAKAAF